MRAPMPNFPCEFEIPEEWWVESGMANFAPRGTAYRSTPGAQLVRLRDIEPPHGRHSRPRDHNGFERDRMVEVLRHFADDVELEPVPLVALPFSDLPSNMSYAYRTIDGYHRFFASIAAGFEALPALIIR
jgi:hypothetical protein